MVLPPSGKEVIMNKQKHLNLEARILIETLLNEHHSFKSIARELGKDCTTISKEVKAHICFEKTGALGRSFNDCRAAFLHQCFSRNFVCVAPTRITSFAGHVASVLLPASLMKNIFARNFPSLPMSAMAVSSALGALWKNVFTRHLMHRKNTNRSEVNPVPALLFPKRN